MITKQTMEALLRDATKAGADAAEVLTAQGEEKGISVRNGKIEKVTSSRGGSLAIALFRGQQRVSANTEDLSREGIKELLEHTIDMMPYGSEDEAYGLADPELCMGRAANLGIFDHQVASLTPDYHKDAALLMEKAALGHDRKIKTVEGSSSSASFSTIRYASTSGIYHACRSSGVSLSVAAVAESQGLMQRDYWYSNARRLRMLESPAQVGRIAATRALRRLNPQPVKTQEVPVVFDPEIAAEFLGIIANLVQGENIRLKTSFLAEKLGENVASELLTIRDDATMHGKLGSRPFDGDGVISRPCIVMEKGKLVSYLLDTYSARKLGFRSTGHAGGKVSNFYLEAGGNWPEEIIASITEGLYVTEFMGFGVNPLTGDFSKGASGFWIKNGALTHPVEGITVAGNLKDMLMNIEMVGNDLQFRSRISAPTIKIAKMMVAGS